MGSPWPQPAGILWVWEGPEDSFSFIPFERCSGTFRGLCQNRTSYFYSRLTVTMEQVRTLSGWCFEVWKELKGSLCFVPGPVKSCSKSYQPKGGQIIRKTNIYKLYYTRPFTNIITFILGDRYYSSILYIEKLNRRLNVIEVGSVRTMHSSLGVIPKWFIMVLSNIVTLLAIWLF